MQTQMGFTEGFTCSNNLTFTILNGNVDTAMEKMI